MLFCEIRKNFEDSMADQGTKLYCPVYNWDAYGLLFCKVLVICIFISIFVTLEANKYNYNFYWKKEHTYVMVTKEGQTTALYRLTHPRVIAVHPDYKDMEAFIASLPARFEAGEGTVIHKARNELRRMDYGGRTYVVKSFHQPNLVNRFIYGVFRSSKAKRSYIHAEAFLRMGVGTPQPVGYMDERFGLLFGRSYYVSRLSECPHVYAELFTHTFDYEEQVLRAIGRATGVLHEHGYAHKDYGRGNILFGRRPDGQVMIEIVDLNRMYIGHVSLKAGCKNFERLPVTPRMRRFMAEEYAKVRGFDADRCCELMEAYRSIQGGKIDDKY